MIISIVSLFLCTLVPGLAVFTFDKLSRANIVPLLNFSGAFLFSITVLHLLPELYHDGGNFAIIGVFIIIGFFLQLFLEVFSSGIEHGHMHQHHTISPYSLLIALFVHSFLEGGIISHPSHMHEVHDTHNILFGVIIHKIPAAIALVTVLIGSGMKRQHVILALLFFSLSSPFGIFISDLLQDSNLLNDQMFLYLSALVAGNFLHISTTIVLETNPDHKLKSSKLAFAVVGALMAIMSEMI